MSAPIRTISQDDILDLLNCAEDYGHWNNVCVSSLWEWASPVSKADIERYAHSFLVKEGYAQEDVDMAIERLMEFHSKFGGTP